MAMHCDIPTHSKVEIVNTAQTDSQPGAHMTSKYDFSGLSKEDLEKIPKEQRDLIMKTNPAMAAQMGIKAEKQETVSKYRYDELEKAFKEEKQRFNNKISELQRQRSDAVRDKNEFEERFNAKRGELEQCQAELSETKEELRKLESEADELRKRPVSTDVQDNMEIRQLRKANEDLEKDVKSLRETKSALETEKGNLESALRESEDRRTELEAELVRMQNRTLSGSEPRLPTYENVGTATMASSTSLKSELFTAPRYSVKISRSLKYMKVRPDIEGKVVCRDGCLNIPRLPEFMPFGDRVYNVTSSDGETLIIELQ